MNPQDPHQIRAFVRTQAYLMRPFIEKAETPPAMAFFINQRGTYSATGMLMLTQEDKEPMRLAFKKLAGRMGVVAAVTIADCYARTLSPKEMGVEAFEEALEGRRIARTGLKDDPGSHEELFATLYTRELHESFRFPYRRDGVHIVWEPESHEDYRAREEDVEDPWDPWDYARKKKGA
jgi:hypothetical protein